MVALEVTVALLVMVAPKETLTVVVSMSLVVTTTLVLVSVTLVVTMPAVGVPAGRDSDP